MHPLEQIKGRVLGTHEDEALAKEIIWTMKMGNIPYQDMMSMPIPAFFEVRNTLLKMLKQENRKKRL
jgi:hypothetical protein